MKKKISKLIFMFIIPVAMFLSLGIFLAGGLVSGYASALAQTGGCFSVGNNSTMNVGTGTTISGFSAGSGGGLYVTSGGTLTMNGGTISGNTATSGSGHNVYNAGTFTMNGGVVGTSGNSQSGYGIYNTGTMKLLGGTVHDNIYSGTSFTTSPSATLNGTITLSNSAKVNVQSYAGTTPALKISLSSSRTEGTILTFSGSSTQPNLSRLTVSGYDTETYQLSVSQGSSSTEWNVSLIEIAVDRVFPSTWDTEVASTDYMTTTVTPSELTSIRFEKTVPSGYVQIGKLSTGLKVYQNSSEATKIAFVNSKTIFAPENSSYLFSGCSSLNSLVFNNFNTSKVTAMFAMFYNRSSLTSLDVSGFNTSSVTEMGWMFYNCSGLTNLDVSGFDTSKVTNMNAMFYNCSSLTSLDVSGFKTSKVENMGSMFYNCSGLTNLDVRGFDTSSVDSMNAMFHDCSSLTSLDVSNFNTSKVENMGVMFYNCSSLTSLDVSGFDTSKVTSMNAMFSNCSRLTSLDLSGFNTTNVTDMSSMFFFCLNLTSLDVSGFNTSNVTDMGWMFHTCSSLTSLDLRSFNTSKVTDMEGMFKNSQRLTSLDLRNFNTSNVTTMRIMFDSCSSLTTLDLSSFDMTNVTSYAYMLTFGSNAVLKQLKTPYNNKSELSITNGKTLYDVSTGSSVSSVSANLPESRTYATKVTLTLDSNGGSCSTSSLSVYYGELLSNQGVSLPTATKSGCSFLGWYNSISGGTKYSNSSVFIEDETLYARYKEDETNAYVEFGYEEQSYFNELVEEGTSSVVICGTYMGDITAIAFLSAYKNSNARYTFESVTQEVGSFYACMGTPTQTRIKNIMGQYVLCFMPRVTEKYISFNNIFNILNSFTNVTALDLRGCDPSTWIGGTLSVPSSLSAIVLPQNFSESVSRSSSSTGVYNYSGSNYDNVQSFASSSDLQNTGFELVKPFVLKKEQLTVEVNIGDEKILDTKRKIKVISNIKKE